MLTLRRVNKEIKARGWQVELVPGVGYFWLDGDDACWAYSSSIGVFRLNHLTLEQWRDRIQDIVEESRAKKP